MDIRDKLIEVFNEPIMLGVTTASLAVVTIKTTFGPQSVDRIVEHLRRHGLKIVEDK